MSDFGSLLSQFQKDADKLKKHRRSPPTNSSKADDSTRPSKRICKISASSFPPVRTVYCLCPAGVQTGGPEALHQLCDQLNRLEDKEEDTPTTRMESYMVYCKSNSRRVWQVSKARTPAAYESYQTPPSDADPLSEHRQDVLLVWPECWTDELLDYLQHSKTTPSPCAIWWLSVNNNTGKFKDWHRQDILHLVQSDYARDYVIQKGATHVYPMTEYISNPPTTPLVPLDERTIDVLYNPIKGIHYTDEIRKRSRSIDFRPIGGQQRLTPEQVRQLLQKAKIYIDFGPHPGMDRLPREAALAGCMVVTNRQGAAGHDEDVPLPAKYKIHEFNVDAIDRLLQDLLEHAEERTQEFDDYRAWIRNQPLKMKECVSNFVEEIVTKRQDKTTSNSHKLSTS